MTIWTLPFFTFLPWKTTTASVMNCKWRWINNELWATAVKSLMSQSLTNCCWYDLMRMWCLVPLWKVGLLVCWWLLVWCDVLLYTMRCLVPLWIVGLLMMSKYSLWSTDTGYDSDYRWTNSEDEGCLVWQGVLYYPVCSNLSWHSFTGWLSRVWLVHGSWNTLV